MNDTPLDRSAALLLIVLAGSLSLNVVLGLQAVRHQQPVSASEHVAGLREGSVLANVPVIDQGGNRVPLLSQSSRRTVLYVMSPSCQWCAKNLANIQWLSQAKSDAYQFLAVSNTETGLKDYVARGALRFPVYALDIGALTRAGQSALVHEFDPTPQTVVLSPAGQVIKVWVGAIRHPEAEVNKYFGVTLPGLISE